MADDDLPRGPGPRPDEGQDPIVAGWLGVEPLDDVTRRRLVSTALHESAPGPVDDPVEAAVEAPPRSAPPRAWRWIAAAAAVVVLLVGGLALLTAQGGNDEPQATRAPESLSQKANGDVLDAGDFGDLDQPTNLAALRTALDAALASDAAAPSAAPLSTGDAAASERSAAGAGATTSRLACFEELPDGATVVARATGTLGGRSATVVVTQLADGTRSYDAVFEEPCEIRPLGTD